MSKKGYAFFAKNPRRIEELICPHLAEQEREYEVVKTLRLPKTDYENFITDMLVDREILEIHAALCSTEGCIMRCLRLTCSGSDESVLVVPNGARVELAALQQSSSSV